MFARTYMCKLHKRWSSRGFPHNCGQVVVQYCNAVFGWFIEQFLKFKASSVTHAVFHPPPWKPPQGPEIEFHANSLQNSEVVKLGHTLNYANVKSENDCRRYTDVRVESCHACS